MILRECVIEISCKNNARAVDKDIQLWLVLLLSLILVESAHSDGGFLNVVLFHELILYSLDKIFALVIVSDVGDDHSGLSWELGGNTLERDLVLAHQDDDSALVQVPEGRCLADTARGASDNNPFVEEVIFERLLLVAHLVVSHGRLLLAILVFLIGIVATE